MEPISYRDALRRWPLVVVLAVVGAVIAVLFPVSSAPARSGWWATSLVGIPPSGGSGVTLSKFMFYAQSKDVMTNAAQAAGVRQPAQSLLGDLLISGGGKSKSGSKPSGLIGVAVVQPTAQGAATLTNAFVTALNNYINQQLANRQAGALALAQQRVSDLQTQLQNVNQQIADMIRGGGSGSTVTTPTTAPTTGGRHHHSSGASSGGGGGNRPRISTNPTLSDLVVQSQAISKSYSDAITKLHTLQEAPTPHAGLTVLRPADAVTARKLTAKPSAFAHRSVRAGVGFAGGAVLGAALALLLEMVNKRLRSGPQAERKFGFPVVAEIPRRRLAPEARRKSGQKRSLEPSLEVMANPRSPVAEAYRMLRVAILHEPLAGDVITAPGPEVGAVAVPAPGVLVSGADPNRNGPSRNGHAGSGAPLWVGEPVVRHVQLVQASRPGLRQVVLVVSPGVEPSRPVVVANLAATYAEAGQRALVITTQDLRSDSLPDNRPVSAYSTAGEIQPADIEANAVPTQIANVAKLRLDQLLPGPGQLATHCYALLVAARQVADVVIVEAPSLLVAHDAEALTSSADVVVVVAECEVTRLDEAAQSGDLLRRMGAPVLGVALTRVRLRGKDLRRNALWEERPPPVEPRKRRAKSPSSKKTKRATHPGLSDILLGDVMAPGDPPAVDAGVSAPVHPDRAEVAANGADRPAKRGLVSVGKRLTGWPRR
jgi:Mrp family chromosome partitioning ATPase